METESRLAVARSWGREEWGTATGCRVSIWGDEKALKLDSGDGCTTL